MFDINVIDTSITAEYPNLLEIMEVDGDTAYKEAECTPAIEFDSEDPSDQGKIIESLRRQIESQNQRLTHQEKLMRILLAQVQQLTVAVNQNQNQIQNPQTESQPPQNQPPPANNQQQPQQQQQQQQPQQDVIIEIFKEMQFFITANGGGDPTCGVPQGTSLPYPKDKYLCAIVKCGGQVIDNVGRETLTNAYLISDKPARTVKYIFCLAAGIPCLSYEWIRKCIAQREVVDWRPFRLESGFSIERQVVIESHSEKPLKDTKVFIATDSDELYAYWKPILVAAQANLLNHCKSALVPPPGTELIITDCACRKELLDAAKDAGIPTVRPEWLVQTIILGEKADVNRQDLYGVPDDMATESESE